VNLHVLPILHFMGIFLLSMYVFCDVYYISVPAFRCFICDLTLRLISTFALTVVKWLLPLYFAVVMRSVSGSVYFNFLFPIALITDIIFHTFVPESNLFSLFAESATCDPNHFTHLLPLIFTFNPDNSSSIAQ